MAELPLDDIQGLILRSYLMPALRVTALRVRNALAAQQFLGKLVSGQPAEAPQVTTGEPWTEAPPFTVNLAVTSDGLKALGARPATLDSFPEEFVQGPIARAALVGDEGSNSPEHWRPELQDEVHLLLIVFAQSAARRDEVSSRLRDLYTAEAALEEAGAYDGDMLPGYVAHFGYKDGFSQPRIEGGPPSPLPIKDPLPASEPGAFVLGHPSQFDQFTYPVPQPPELGLNGSFVAFRLLEQDCAGFEKFLTEAPEKYGIPGELMAAKICGRWRNGVPLALSPETDSPDPPIPLEELNNFDYAPTEACPHAFNDRKGYRVPIGSHIRRNNPRNSMVAGGSPLKRRIIRRGLPYGPLFDPSNPDDGIERGLIGLFIGASLKDQYEFLMKDWVNKGDFAPGIGGTKDPVIGSNDPADSQFKIPREGQKPIVVSGFARFVRTRGAAYGFIPSLTAIRHLARLSVETAVAVGSAGD